MHRSSSSSMTDTHPTVLRKAAKAGSCATRLRLKIAKSSFTSASCDSFFETDLQARLKENGITRLVVGGCMTQFCVDTTARRAVSLGYDVTLMSDGHMTADMGELRFEQIIAHHNAVLDEFDAGNHEIRLAQAAAVNFG